MENVENPKAPIKPHFFACHSVGRSVERLAKTGWTFVDKSDSAFSVIFAPHLAGRVFLDVSTPFPRVFHSGKRRGRRDEGCGGFLGRKPPTPKELEQMVCRGGYHPPENDAFTGDAGNFLLRKFPAPFKELADGLWELCLVSRHFAYGKTLAYFFRGLKGMQASPFRLGQKSAGIFPRGGKFCPRQEA